MSVGLDLSFKSHGARGAPAPSELCDVLLQTPGLPDGGNCGACGHRPGETKRSGVAASRVAGARRWPSTAKGKGGVVTVTDGRVQAAITTARLTPTCGVAWLSVVFPEVKFIGSQLNSHLSCIKRKAPGQVNKV